MKSDIELLPRRAGRRPGVALAAAAAQLLCAGIAGAQTRIDLASQSRNGIFSTGGMPVTFGASGPTTWAFTIPAGSAPSAPVSGSFWVSNGKLWWHNGTRPVAFLNDDGSGSGAVSWHMLGAAGGNLLVNTNGYSTTLSLGTTSGATHGFRVTDGAGNAGIGILGHFTSASGSQTTPWQADANGTGWQVDKLGRLRTVGSATSGAITLSGSDTGSCTLTVPAAGGALTPGSAAECDFGSLSAPVANLYLAGASASPGTNNFKLTGSATAARTWTLPDASDIFIGRATADVFTHKTFDTAGTGNVLRIGGVQQNAVQGNSGVVLQAGTVSGTGAALCTDANGNATTSGCAAAGQGIAGAPATWPSAFPPPPPSSTTLGGVKALTCAGTDKVTGIATDGSPTCGADQSGGGGGAASGYVTAPATPFSAGIAGNWSGDANYHYWHDGSRWQRVAADAGWGTQAAAATPTFTPPAGTYFGAQPVTIASTTTGATICYTTDGSTPAATLAGTCSAGTTYTAALTLPASATVKALATKTGYATSTVASAVYSIQPAVTYNCTTTATGTLWSSAAHWTNCGGRTPQSGDTATIAHNTTVDAAATVGAAPPGAPTSAPTVNSTGGGSTGGSLPACTNCYYLAYTQVDANGAESLASTGWWYDLYSAPFSVAAGNIPRVTFPARPSGVASYNVYLLSTNISNQNLYLYATGITGTTYDLAAPINTGNRLLTALNDGLYVNSGVTLTVSSALTVRGNLVTRGNVTFTAGSSLTFDGSAATYNGQYQFVTGYQSDTVMITGSGTTSAHVTIGSAAAGPHALGNLGGPASITAIWSLSYVDFVGMGDATHDALYHNGYTFSMDHCTFDAGSGRVWAGPFYAGQSYTVTNNRFAQAAPEPLRLTISGAGSGSWLFDRNSFAASTGTPKIYTANGQTITNNFFGRAPSLVLTSNWTTWNNNFVREWVSTANPGDCANGAVTLAGGSASNTFVYSDCTVGNPHFIGAASGTYDGFILEYRGPVMYDPGDGFMYGATNPTANLTVQNTIILPPSTGTAMVDGVETVVPGLPSANLLNVAVGSTGTAYHNTFPINGQAGLVMADYGQAAGMFPTFKSNLGWTPSACPACYLVEMATGNPSANVLDTLNGAGADYNYSWNAATGYARSTVWPGVAAPGYDARTSVAPGQHDLWQTGGNGPAFVDGSRNLANWAVSRGSTAGTLAGQLADAYSYLYADPTLITNLLSYVRGGYQPTNTALKGAAHDGGTIGAVVMP